MIVVDTNVLSALMKTEPDETVASWLDTQPAASIWTTAVTVFEIRFGLELLPQSRRRRALERAFDVMLADDLESRIMPFDADAAREAGIRAAERQRAGASVEIRDIEIAGIVAAHRATLATRNVRHFQGLRIPIVNPWSES